jgi:hypothetical protein
VILADELSFWNPRWNAFLLTTKQTHSVALVTANAMRATVRDAARGAVRTGMWNDPWNDLTII